MVLPAQQTITAANSSYVCRTSGSVSDCKWPEQQTVSAVNLTDACNTIIDSGTHAEPRRGQTMNTASNTAVAVGVTSKRLAVICSATVSRAYLYNTINTNISWFSSSLFRKSICFSYFFVSANSWSGMVIRFLFQA